MVMSSSIPTTKKQRDELTKLILNAPKPQLHIHLDGSLSFNFVKVALERLKTRRRSNGNCNNKKMLNHSNIFFGNNNDGANYWEPQNEMELIDYFRKLKRQQQQGTNGWNVGKSQNWDVFNVCNSFLQTSLDLQEATCDLVKRLALGHHVNYMEIRFAPVLHTLEGLTQEEAVLAVIEGFKQGTQLVYNDRDNDNNFKVYGGIILCALRSHPPIEAMQTVQLIQDHHMKNKNNNDEGYYLLGLDIAGDERTYPLELFKDALQYAIDNNIKTTVHAGEWKHGCEANLRLAVDIGVNRIGHGLGLGMMTSSSSSNNNNNNNDDGDDDIIFEQIREKNISIEVCLTGNCSHVDKCASFIEHPLRDVFVRRHKLNIAGLNVDNMLLSGNEVMGCPNPTDEFVRAIYDCRLSSGKEILDIVECGYRSAFYNNLPEAFIVESIQYWKDVIIPHLEYNAM